MWLSHDVLIDNSQEYVRFVHVWKKLKVPMTKMNYWKCEISKPQFPKSAFDPMQNTKQTKQNKKTLHLDGFEPLAFIFLAQSPY